MSYRRYPKYDARRYACAVFPFLPARHIHHTAYGGPELLWVDVLPVSVFAHWLIHCVAGGSLRMHKAVTRQNRSPLAKAMPLLFKYPNPAQRLIHLWARVPGFLRIAGVLLGLWHWTIGLQL